MLRELLDKAALEDFVGGLARALGMRFAVYDSQGTLITASPPRSAYALQVGALPDQLPRPLEFTAVPADEPPARLAFVQHASAWYIVAPVFAGQQAAGYIGLGEYRLAGTRWEHAAGLAEDASTVRQGKAWEALPELSRTGDTAGVHAVRWASRQLSQRCRQEAQLDAASEELSLISDIGELLSGEQNLQRLLERIVGETARVMRCPYCSLRLYDATADELRAAAAHGLSERYARKGAILRRENPIDDIALRGNVVYIENVQADERVRFKEAARQQGLVSGLTVGMLYHGRPVGVLRVYTDVRRQFRASQRHVLRSVASQAAVAIVNARLAEERLRAARMERQIELAGQLQRRMVRARPPAFDGVSLAFVFEPTWHIGGDFCDFLILPDGRLAAVVVDVVGHGVPASLLMAYVRGALRAQAQQCSDLGAILTALNRQLCRETESAEFVTMLIVAVSPDRRRLYYCNAGHEPLALLRDGRTTPASDGGLALGIQEDERFCEHALELAAGDFVLLYTDGATEAMDYQGAAYGRERLLEALRQHGDLAPDWALRAVHWDIRRFVGLAEQTDDLTMVGLRIVSVA